jgi:hypothetical protein
MRSKVRKVKPNYHYSNPIFIRGAYKKALLVIRSCENEYHLKATQKYLSNFLLLQSEEIGYKEYKADSFVLKSFDRLVKKFNFKQKELGI